MAVEIKAQKSSEFGERRDRKERKKRKSAATRPREDPRSSLVPSRRGAASGGPRPGEKSREFLH